MTRGSSTSTVGDQISASIVNVLNALREEASANLQRAQDAALGNALRNMHIVREFVGSPEKILGSPSTKHGEIAEQLEVGIRNAQAALHGKDLPADILGVGRTDRVDYFIDDIGVQSKFYNGARNTLGGVLEHMDKYEEFGRDSSYYHIPKDQFELIQKLKEDPHAKSAILDKVAEIERLAGKPFEEVVRPASSTYAEPQQGAIHSTLDRHEARLNEENERLKDAIREEHQPSMGGAAQAAAAAGAVAAGIGLATAIYRKSKSGKNLLKGDYTAEDWKEVGLDTGKAAVGGAVAGGAIYMLTNFAELSAPFAGAIVSAAKGMASLSSELAAGKITQEQFIDLGLAVCAESAIVGLATIAGQALIPIPVLGGLIGSISGKMISQFATGLSEGASRRLNAEIAAFEERLDAASRKIFAEINEKFDHLGRLTAAAFDLNLNRQLLLQNSATLAEAYCVEESKIMRTVADVDAFMLS